VCARRGNLIKLFSHSYIEGYNSLFSACREMFETFSEVAKSPRCCLANFVCLADDDDDDDELLLIVSETMLIGLLSINHVCGEN
jgi:hypothetical protein